MKISYKKIFPVYSSDPSHLYLPPLPCHHRPKGARGTTSSCPGGLILDALSFTSLQTQLGGPSGRMLKIPGAAKVMRCGHRENQDKAFSAVGIQTPCLSGCGVPLFIFLNLIYVLPDQLKPHLEEYAYRQNSRLHPGETFSSQGYFLFGENGLK